MTLLDRTAGAPISWGVCEVPDWGVVLPPERVLAEMQAVGLRATELGPDGYLATAAPDLRAQLAAHELRLVGGFVPAVMHVRATEEEQLAVVTTAAERLAAGGASIMVLAASTGAAGYESRPVLEPEEWQQLARFVERAADAAAAYALDVAVHPHVGTVVETKADVEQLLDLSPAALCVDTGHLLIGGTDPLELVRAVPDRVRHVHLKDVDAALAGQVTAGELTYQAAVSHGLYRPLGAGDVPVADVVDALEASGYRGWYVLEQDTALTDGEPPPGAGPINDVLTCIEFMRSLDKHLSGR
jgi:inosose dehydratase